MVVHWLASLARLDLRFEELRTNDGSRLIVTAAFLSKGALAVRKAAHKRRKNRTASWLEIVGCAEVAGALA